MEKFNHYVAIKVDRWGKGLLGENVQIEEYDHMYFGDGENIDDHYKLIDKLFRAGKREYIAISLYEAGGGESTRRLFIRLDAGLRQYGTADVAYCDRSGCFDHLTTMSAKCAKEAAYSIIDDVAIKCPPCKTA